MEIEHAIDDGTDLLLGPLLRYVDGDSATVWVETARPATVEVLGATTSTFSIHGRHYALVIIDDLAPGTATPYEVHIDGTKVWPEADSPFPNSLIRTPSPDHDPSILVGSCRAAAPHEPPYTLELTLDHEGRGVDVLWAHARRMLTEQPNEWPDLLLLVGDQIYADDSSPRARERIEQRRGSDADLPPAIVANFEEYCWLYHEAWSGPLERWLLSTVPSAMIFDDHDNIDDWNISQAWVAEMRTTPWWGEHAIGGLTSYFIYQHLGNLSPATIREQGILAELLATPDGTSTLRTWATDVEAATPLPGGYQFSYVRTVGTATVVVIDCRNGRVLDGSTRLMVGADEWDWICDQAASTTGHLVLATSVPVFIADGLHDLQVWNEQVCDGAWGRMGRRFGERLRRGLDLEDWSAFGVSYEQFVQLLTDLRGQDTPPKSMVVASGDIHFSYAATVPQFDDGSGPLVWQVVSSPIRNALIPPERGVLRATLTPMGARAGALLRRLGRGPRNAPHLEMAVGPFFANNMCELHYAGRSVELSIEQAAPNDDDEPELHEVARLLLQSAPTADRPMAVVR